MWGVAPPKKTAFGTCENSGHLNMLRFIKGDESDLIVRG